MRINSKIVLAIPKGRIAKEIMSLLSSLNLDPEKDFLKMKKIESFYLNLKQKIFF
mgnify:CR=1 FL=1